MDLPQTKFASFYKFEEDCWTPRKILEVLEERVNNEGLGHNDLPEMILESISKTKEIV